MYEAKAGDTLLAGDECWSPAFGPPPEGQGIDGHVFALIPFHGNLVAGGEFTLAGRQAVQNVAGWDGSTWTPLGREFTGRVDYLCIYEGELVAGGRLRAADGAELGVVGIWNGLEWQWLGRGFDGEIRGLTVFRGNLIAAVNPKQRFRKRKISLFGWKIGSVYVTQAGVTPGCLWVWNGFRWSEFEGALTGNINDIRVIDGSLLVIGDLFCPESRGEKTVLEWDGNGWKNYTWKKLDAPRRLIDYSGKIVVGGAFDCLGYIWEGGSFVMMWTGEKWQDLGEPPDLAATALETHRGSLTAAGNFRRIGGRPAKYVARWAGDAWHPLGSGIESEYFIPVRAVTSAGDNLYVGGSFHKAGGKPSAGIACWQG